MCPLWFKNWSKVEYDSDQEAPEEDTKIVYQFMKIFIVDGIYSQLSENQERLFKAIGQELSSWICTYMLYNETTYIGLPTSSWVSLFL